MEEMGNELTVHENKPLTAMDVAQNKALIQRVMAACMKADIHYGIIPGTKKPTLYKPGSEAILSTFRIAVIPEIQDLSTIDEIRYRVLAKGVLPDGTVVGCGVGECSTNEEKYKWRSALCDEEFDETPEMRRRVKFSAKWDQRSRQKEIVKVKQIRTEPSDLANTALKMAKKRAQIDLTLTATGASDVFDQDLDSLPPEIVDEFMTDQEQQPTGGKPVSEPPKAKPKSGEKLATEGQVKMLHAKLRAAGCPVDSLLSRYQIDKVESLPFAKVTEAAQAIDGGDLG
jgi:hypothetical protein